MMRPRHGGQKDALQTGKIRLVLTPLTPHLLTVTHTVCISFHISLRMFFHTKYVLMWLLGLSGLGNDVDSAQAQKSVGGQHHAMEEITSPES